MGYRGVSVDCHLGTHVYRAIYESRVENATRKERRLNSGQSSWRESEWGILSPLTLVRKKQPLSATSQDPPPTPGTSPFAIMKDCYARDPRLHTAHWCQTEIQEAFVEGMS
jgi:hypothetical protein